jgi:uncharacterized protein (TIGR00255 family)
MTRSMTAFARQEADTPWGSLTWELRTVNHRYLEISPRLPDELRALEPRVRALIASRLERGKVEGVLRFQPRESTAQALEVDEAQVRRLAQAAATVRRVAGDAAPVSAMDLLRWPGVIQAPPPDVENLGARALELLTRALDDLVATRVREGARLEEFLRERLAALEQTLGRVREILPEVTRLFREKLEARLSELKGQADPARLEQELVLFASKSDVAEELERLAAHAAEIRRVLAGGGQVGRRLDFLMQELNREANTLASKSADVRTTTAAVDLKALIEQMREQVQNIE